MASDFVYASLAECKGRVNLQGAGDDVWLTALLISASRAIDNFCNRPDGFRALGTATARRYAGSGKSWQEIDECMQVTLVEVKESGPSDDTWTAWESTDWLAFCGDVERPDFNRTPYIYLMVDPTGSESHFPSGRYGTLRGFRPDPDRGSYATPTIRVTARWGYADDTPGPVKEATIEQAARWYKRGQSAWADTVGSAETGVLAYRQAVDPDIAFMLKMGRLVRPSVG